MTVLVTAATKHGATLEIAEAIAHELNDHGVEADAVQPGGVGDVGAYHAVVLGSAVYMGRWVDPALAFVERHQAVLSSKPVWIFSSGPIGTPPRPEETKAVNVDEILARTGAREHRVFGGKVDSSRLGFGERVVVRAVGAGDGDYREWDEIRDWATQIADRLTNDEEECQ